MSTKETGNKKDGYIQKVYPCQVKRYCQMLDLVDDEQLINKYRSLHSSELHWKEIREGIKKVGILEMELYICGNRLFMIVDTPVNFDWDLAMAQLAELPRQDEWEDTVAVFQACRPGTTSAQKWTLMERMFYLYD